MSRTPPTETEHALPGPSFGQYESVEVAANLRRTLRQSRAAATRLRNVILSSGAATVLLDTQLKVRFFSPAARPFFNLAAGDVGRPLADVDVRGGQGSFIASAQTVLDWALPVEREFQSGGSWFIRRIVPYRVNAKVRGVVANFLDVTDQHLAATAMVEAIQRAERATIAKSRSLAVANHKLRQPLQTLALLQGMLARTVEGELPQRLVAQITDLLGAMTGTLNALLDISRLGIGTTHADVVDVPLGAMLDRLQTEFSYPAQARGLRLIVVPTSAVVRSDAHLLEALIRNLVTNAVAYTTKGKVLLGCRRRGRQLSIQVWDTGLGIAAAELEPIFDEYHQVESPTVESNEGIGLGLTIVRSFGAILGHRVSVRSREGRGSVFSIEVDRSPLSAALPTASRRDAPAGEAMKSRVPGITTRGPSTQAVANGPRLSRRAQPNLVYVVDDDGFIRDGVRSVLEEDGLVVEDFSSAEAFLETYRINRGGCILIDEYLPGIDGLELLERLRATKARLPAIMITGRSDVPIAVKAMKAGAADFIEKPIGSSVLLASVRAALDRWSEWNEHIETQESAIKHLVSLTARQRQIMALVLAGQPNKNIATDLGISQRTVEYHRASIMRKTGAASLPALARLAVAAAEPTTNDGFTQ